MPSAAIRQHLVQFPVATTIVRRPISSTSSLHVEPRTDAKSDARETTVGSDTIGMVSDNEDIEMTRHYEKTMAQDAISAAASGDIRVMPSAPNKYHRVREMHSD
ncbi:hypothetical protein H4R24_000005 [Coemansia sp. RSA 988]|nr:hypothetical protein H4R24_003350 [Coemansia sp. RSA 988]KAJ2084473.1 hypothetical protein H4R24_000005 [Coemansia sp. RSA 988]